MDTLRLIVKSILIIIFMASFLEIVLPRSDMKRYVNLVIGLFVILAVVNPLLSVMDKDFSFDVFETAARPADSNTEALIRKGKELGDSQKAQAVSQYKEKLAKQVAALTRLYPDIGINHVDVEIVEDTTSPEFGTLKRIVLRTDSRSGDAGDSSPGTEVRVKEVRVEDIGEDSAGQVANSAGRIQTGGGTAETGKNTAGLKDVIANFYGLTPEQVVIEE